nr:hypothetical protein [Tanacetum cinerariifolium]
MGRLRQRSPGLFDAICPFAFLGRVKLTVQPGRQQAFAHARLDFEHLLGVINIVEHQPDRHHVLAVGAFAEHVVGKHLIGAPQAQFVFAVTGFANRGSRRQPHLDVTHGADQRSRDLRRWSNRLEPTLRHRGRSMTARSRPRITRASGDSPVTDPWLLSRRRLLNLSTGELLSIHQPSSPAFLATKVWTRGRDAGIAQMEDSFRLLQTERIDLMQIHNLLDWKTHLPTLRAWKEEGRVRYIGLTHYTASAYDEVEAALKAESFDFLQINYALDDRAIEARLLPLCRERGVAVICNRPFGGGGLLGRLRDTALPGWAGEVQAKSWAQLALKFLISHPAVTCV